MCIVAQDSDVTTRLPAPYFDEYSLRQLACRCTLEVPEGRQSLTDRGIAE